MPFSFGRECPYIGWNHREGIAERKNDRKAVDGRRDNGYFPAVLCRKVVVGGEQLVAVDERQNAGHWCGR